MVKLTQLRPLIGRLPPMLGPAPGEEKERNRYRADREPWRAWYQTARWKRIRISVFTRDLFTCQECGAIISDTSKLVAHHKRAHKVTRHCSGMRPTSRQHVRRAMMDRSKPENGERDETYSV